ncbi:MAG: hypothetical protein AAFP19_20610 [Bacteroidota bacterium]
MKTSFQKALRCFKWLVLLCSIAYWPIVIIDDWIFIEQHSGASDWFSHLGFLVAFYLAFGFVFSVYYWLAVTVFILLYHKLIHPMRQKRIESDTIDQDK